MDLLDPGIFPALKKNICQAFYHLRVHCYNNVTCLLCLWVGICMSIFLRLSRESLLKVMVLDLFAL